MIEIVKQTLEPEIREILGIPNYEFPHHVFDGNEHLKDRVAMICMGGSLAYGTNLPGKGDVDLRGMFMEKPDEVIGMKRNPEHVVDTETDTVMYSFNKLVTLLLENNPNTIECLGCKPEHYFFLNTIGSELIKHQEMFLSKRCIDSFGGYANQQLNRLENAIARDRLSEERKNEHVKASMENSLKSFETQYAFSQFGTASLYTGKSKTGDPEIYIDMDFKGFPVRDFNSLMNVLTNVYRSYNKLNHRNHKKDEEHLDKHAMHLLRLYFMVLDILEQRKVITYREKEQPLLLDVRKGKFRNPDGSYNSAFFDLRTEMNNRFKYAALHTELPPEPNFGEVNDFVFSMNRLIIDY